MSWIIRSLLLSLFFFSQSALAVSCGFYDGKFCNGTAFQYGGSFNPQVGEYGGFGGAANCTASRTPVIFVHGNGDNATSWDSPTAQVPGYPKAPNSMYQQFKAAGYKDCELFGVSYLTASERLAEQYNFHKPSKYAIVENFIRAVKKYTGKSQVDVVGHSLGVSMAMATLTYYGDWGSVRRFVNIAGGLRGLDTCLWVGYANPGASTCGSQNVWDPNVFGFYPDSAFPGINPWTGTTASKALPRAALTNNNVLFYTVYAGKQDQIMCSTVANYATCEGTPRLMSASNVKAQINVGAGSNALEVNWDWTKGSPLDNRGGDTDGVGHMRARNNTGTIVVKMLSTTCSTGCAADYLYGPVQ